MVRTVKSHHEEEEEDDDEFLSRANDGSSQKGGKSNDQRLNSHRSKHSETEQRRRSKINERFQILRDLIPQNDQKRDKASFLLEVIQYIQFLQEKLQIYEGTYQGWSLEQPSKLMPWKNSCGPVEGLIDQSQLIKNGSLHEDSIIVSPPALLNNAPHSIESDLSGPTTYEAIDHPHHALNIAALQPNLFEGVPVPPQGSFSDALHMASQSQSRFWHGRPCSTTECSVPTYSSTEQDDLKIRSEEEASISNSYSQELLNSLTHALKSSGVDVSQASISVQLDVSKQTNSGINSTVFRPQDHMNPPRGNQETTHYAGGSSGEDGNQAHKRLRMEQS